MHRCENSSAALPPKLSDVPVPTMSTASPLGELLVTAADKAEERWPVVRITVAANGWIVERGVTTNPREVYVFDSSWELNTFITKHCLPYDRKKEEV